MIFVDSNIPMYLIGESHPHKIDAQQLLERCITDRERLVTDAEVLQEILHRYVAINRREAIQPAFDVLLSVIDDVLDVTREDVERAKQIVLGSDKISSRDALHLAVMEHHEITSIMSFDSDFDKFPSVKRLR